MGFAFVHWPFLFLAFAEIWVAGLAHLHFAQQRLRFLLHYFCSAVVALVFSNDANNTWATLSANAEVGWGFCRQNGLLYLQKYCP
eukprot:1142073-Pelagomonas_calceolata.AAC.2